MTWAINSLQAFGTKFPGDYSRERPRMIRPAVLFTVLLVPAAAAEFAEYEYERDPRTGEVLAGYPDVNNHHIDAVRYALEGVWRRRGA